MGNGPGPADPGRKSHIGGDNGRPAGRGSLVRPHLRAAAAACAALASASLAGCTLSRAAAEPPPSPPSSAPTTASPHPSATPAPPPALPAGTRRMTVGGRSYLLTVPKNLERPAPLVVALGGVAWS